MDLKYLEIFNDKLKCKDSEEVFNYLIDSLKQSISGWDYFVNWTRVFGKLDDIEIDLNMLNYLIGKEDIEECFRKLLKERNSIFQTVPILIACRDTNFQILQEIRDGAFIYNKFDFSAREITTSEDIDRAVEFAKSSGFLDLLKTKRIKNVVDYVIGVEVGLDSNARKNRGGKAMESVLGVMIDNMCSKEGCEFLKSATARSIKEKWNISVEVQKTSRIFDFAVYNHETLYLIETNFYEGGGSKLKSTAGEYRKLFNTISANGHRFIWITDGVGWLTTTNSLREAFDEIDYILNLEFVSKGILEEIINNDL